MRSIVNRDHDIEQHLKQLASLGFQFSIDQVSSLNIDCEYLIKNRFKYDKFDAEILLDEILNPIGPIAVADIKRVFNRQRMDLIVEKIETAIVIARSAGSQNRFWPGLSVR